MNARRDTKHRPLTIAVACLSLAVTVIVPSRFTMGNNTVALAQDLHEHGDQEPDQGPIRLTEAQQAEFGIITEKAAPATIKTTVELTGEIRPNADRLAHVVPRFDGIVTEVRKSVGDKVNAGDILAVIESNESLTSYVLKTLIDGTIISKHITRGEAVSRETEAFVVADLEKVWVDFSVYQQDLDHIHVGQQVMISANPMFEEVMGVISYVTPVLAEETRTATARVILSNLDGRWRPGMFVTGKVTVAEKQATVAVSRIAVQTLNGEPVVFIVDKDSFEPRRITLGDADDTYVEILGGLATGNGYVSRGSFILKSEVLKAGFTAGHAH